MGAPYCYAEVNLSHYAHNLGEIARNLPRGAKIMAVIKANAYGHGIVEIARKAHECGVFAFGVARFSEAKIVREILPNARILILGFSENIAESIAQNIELCVFSKDLAREISNEAMRQNKIAKIHIKIDTGMGRIGFVVGDSGDSCESDLKRDSRDSREIHDLGESFNRVICDIVEISKMPNLQIEGVFTHFSSADEADSAYTQMQFERFLRVTNALESHGVRGFLKHCANSAAAIKYPQFAQDLVRAGIISYGLEVPKTLDLKPVIKLKARVVCVKTLAKGSAVSYNRTFIAQKPTKIATLPIGYADGYSRLLSNRAEVLIDGKRARIVGNVCMDQVCVDVSEIPCVKVGDCAVLLGTDEFGNEISARELANLIGTISYEVVCAISSRIPRVYVR